MTAHCIEIASRVFGTPLFIHPQKAEIVAWALRDRIAPGLSLEEPKPGPEADRFVGTRERDGGRTYALNRATGGVAIISVIGSLVNRGAWVGASSGLTSYEGLSAQIREAMNDREVHSILLDINSPGGEAAGMFNLAAAIREARKSKRVVASVNDMAASAAYGIASAADEIVVSPTSIVGSIGVVMMHLDRSGELAAMGIKATLIYAGSHKVDGNPLGPLTQEVAADLQRDVATFYDRFIETVEAGRGARTTAAMARGTEARTYIGKQGIAAGLADRVATFEQALTELTNKAARSSSSTSKSGSMQMSDKNSQRAKTESDAIAAGWKKAVTAANQKLGVAIEGNGDRNYERDSAIKDSWSRAVAAANQIFGVIEEEVACAGNSDRSGEKDAAITAGWARAVADANRMFE